MGAAPEHEERSTPAGEDGADRPPRPTFNERLRTMQAFAKGRTSVVYMKGGMAGEEVPVQTRPRHLG